MYNARWRLELVKLCTSIISILSKIFNLPQLRVVQYCQVDSIGENRSFIWQIRLRNISRYSGTRVEACLFDRFVLFDELRIFWTIPQVECSIWHSHLISDTSKYFTIFWDPGWSLSIWLIRSTWRIKIFWTILQVEFSIWHLHLISDTIVHDIPRSFRETYALFMWKCEGDLWIVPYC